MLMSYSMKKFPKDYIPTVFDNYSANVIVNGKQIALGLWDTAGQEDYDKLRPLSYPQTDIFLLCFSVDSRHSFENLKKKWAIEVKTHQPNAPIIMVGTKLDMRTPGSGEDYVQSEEGEFMLKQMVKEGYNVVKYIECSALDPDLNEQGLKRVFDEAIKTVLQARQKPKKKSMCLIL